MRIRIKLDRLLYMLFVVCMTVDAAFANTTIPEYYKEAMHDILLAGALTFAFLCVLFKRYSVKKLVVSLSIYLFGVCSYIVSGNTDLMISLLLIMLIRDIDVDVIIRLILKIRVVIFSSVVLMSLIGILEKGRIALESADKGVLFGYGHANTFAGNAGLIILLMLAVNRKKLKNSHLLFAALFEVVVFYFSRTRISLVLIMLTIVMLLYFRNRNRAEKFFRICKYIYPAIIIVNFGLIAIRALNILPQFIDFVDGFLNGRILLALMNLEYYPVTFLGQTVDITKIASENMYYALDNGYTYILIHYGIMGLLVFSVLFQLSMLTCKNRQDVVLCTISMVLMLWIIYEGMMISATANFALLFAEGFIANVGWRNVRKSIGVEEKNAYDT